jgi:hypothetical protein
MTTTNSGLPLLKGTVDMLVLKALSATTAIVLMLAG